MRPDEALTVADDASIDLLIQTYDSRYSLDDRTRHSALAAELLGGRANRASGARVQLGGAIAGGESVDPVAAQLLIACDRDGDMALAALEYQIRINTHILGYPEDDSTKPLFGGS